jgi:hypothetical protein
LEGIQPVGILYLPKQRCLEENVCGGGWKGHLTIEQGKVEAVQSEVHQACQILDMG